MSNSTDYLLTGGENRQLLPALRRALSKANEIEIAVSFIKYSGLELIFKDLEDRLEADQTVKLTLLTSDYLSITDPRALRKLMFLAERGADVRIFESHDAISFHLKAYLFVRSEESLLRTADAFVGSSNLSRPALTNGLEWNYHLDFPNEADASAVQRIVEIREKFLQLLNMPEVKPLTFSWIEQYEKRYEIDRSLTPIEIGFPGQDEPEPDIPTPRPHQEEALAALQQARQRRMERALVVLATGLGKTYLAAFDAVSFSARRVLFVAHREEILLQAEESFLAIMPRKRVGRYTGKQKDIECDLLFASVQTLGKLSHLELFARDHFDYIVIDEFHHAAAGSYQKLLAYFLPNFLLGLTATPDRTDRSDILKLCDNNLVYRKDLFDGITEKQLCPFHYYGIYDSEVDYEHIPWRNGKFDPERLSARLATVGRAKHAFREWQAKTQARTLAFCASISHADYMAAYFVNQGVSAASVHTESDLTRSEALEQLASGQIKVLFSVDLFNEGVDLPQIDTVMMLRPTESKILFLQQLGRGLRLSSEKDKLVVLDYVGNHHSFLNRPEMLLGSTLVTAPSRRQLISLAKRANELLPEGCFINYDLEFIQFLESLASDNLASRYEKLKSSLKFRPTLVDFWRSGANLTQLRQHYGSWWEFLDELGDADTEEMTVLEDHAQWFRDLTVTRLSKSYKLVLLQTLLDHKSIGQSVNTKILADWGKSWFQSNPKWVKDLPQSKRHLESITDIAWFVHWRNNPIQFWCTPEQGSQISWFDNVNDSFQFQESLNASEVPKFISMTQEILDCRLAAYAASHLEAIEGIGSVDDDVMQAPSLPYFPDIKIACGHFRTGRADVDELVAQPSGFGALSPERHFIARASGNSMNGGKSPIHDGDYLLLEQVTSQSAGSISNQILAIERQDESGDNQYLLRKILKNRDGSYTLRAQNPDYEDLVADDSMVTFARLRGKVDPFQLFVGREFLREEIATLFGVDFNPGNWQAGHIVLREPRAQILLVTLNKQGKSSDHQYHDYFMDTEHFHWQSQNNTAPEGSRGRGIIEHEKQSVPVYLFVRDHKLRNGKAAPFRFYGELSYVRHEGSKPMNVVWRLHTSLASLR